MPKDVLDMNWQGFSTMSREVIFRNATIAAGQAGLLPVETESNYFKAIGGRSFNVVAFALLLLVFVFPAILYYLTSPRNLLEIRLEDDIDNRSALRVDSEGHQGDVASTLFKASLEE